MADLAMMLLKDGYDAIPRLRQRTGTTRDDAFTCRVLGRRAVVVRGRDAVRLFYDEDVVQREGAVPPPLAALLFGRGAVHGTDGDQHRIRKAMFLGLLTSERVDDLAATIGRDLARRVEGWPGREVSVFDELVEVYGAAVQAWAGIDQAPADVHRTSRRLATVVDGFGGAGTAYARAWAARLQLDRWARDLVGRARRDPGSVRDDTVLADIARGPGSGLDPHLAGVELLNVLRPTVAVAWPGTFLARDLAGLADHSTLGDEARRSLGHEVRRTAPFVPALAGLVRRDTSFDGVALAPGDLLVLDVPGTNAHPDLWNEPERFAPGRFVGHEPDPFGYVPQGGGYPATGHRCPGEPLTVRILQQTADVLAGVPYHVVGSSDHDRRRIPTLPRHGLRVRVG
ncbi:cytochrome P450 [Nocardioides zeicaulis]|uniref:Cytochrome P450 n=1 Tax=Nocardioides zeicaulis TaxID=1776857 RepID=A0ABV6E476_9ACTN